MKCCREEQDGKFCRHCGGRLARKGLSGLKEFLGRAVKYHKNVIRRYERGINYNKNGTSLKPVSEAAYRQSVRDAGNFEAWLSLVHALDRAAARAKGGGE